MGIGLSGTSAPVADAIERLGRFFAQRDTRPGLLARRLLGRVLPGDGALGDHLIRERRVATRMDGSLGGDLVRTAWAAWELMDLGHDHQSAGTLRLVGYLLSRHVSPPEGAAGAVPAFRPADPFAKISPLTLPNGCELRDEEDAAQAANCLALRAALRAGHEERPAIRRHVQALREWQLLWDLRVGRRPLDLAACALAALALAPLDLRDRLDNLASLFAREQLRDGTWSDADFFQVLEAMLATGAPTANVVVHRAVPALLARQSSDGTFDPAAHEERALIGLRALLRAP